MGVVSAGSVVGGYRVESLLGRGGMGSVYCARQVSLDRLVALKLIAPEFATDVGFRERFRREALAAAAIDHPNVVPVFEADEADGRLFIAMQFVDGPNLATIVRSGGPLDLELVVRLTGQVAAALDAAHARGIVHRDVKPGNVLVTGGSGSEHAYLTDFGIAKRGGAAPGLTRAGSIIGSLDYIAPEQILGEGSDARSDLYALGCVVFELMTGTVPFAADEEAAKLHSHLHQTPPSARAQRPELPPGIDAVLQRAMAKRPPERFATAESFAQALASSCVLDPSERSSAPTVIPSVQPDAPGLAKLLRSRRAGLPALPTPLVGRRAAVREVAAIIASPDIRLLTLVGPGGTGKTRLAIAACEQAAHRFDDGVCFVDLSAVAAPDQVGPRILDALGLEDMGGEPIADRLRAYFEGKQMLLLLDNFEQVVDAAPLIGGVLAGASGLAAVVTSRQPLHLAGEREWPVEPLDAADSVELFHQRASAVHPSFVVAGDAVAQVCERVDRLPLAIELAAARVKLLPPAELLIRLDERFKLLTGGSRDSPSRQQTLRATIDWSHALLAPGEQRLLARLAIFVGGCTLGAIEAVCGPDLEVDVLDGLDALIDHSLIRRREGDSDEPRYTMLETIRAYAHERLVEQADSATIAERHADYYADLAERARIPLLGEQAATWHERLVKDEANLVEVLRWTEEQARLERGFAIAGLAWRFTRWGARSEVRTWLERATVSEGGTSPERAAGLFALAFIRYNEGSNEAALDAARKCLAEANLVHDREQAAMATGLIGALLSACGDSRAGIAAADEAVAMATPLGGHVLAHSVRALVFVLAAANDERFAAALDLGLQLAIEQGDARSTSLMLNQRGWMDLVNGDNEKALHSLSRALAAAPQYEPFVRAMIVANLGWSELGANRAARALSFFSESLEAFVDYGDDDSSAEVLLGIAAALAAEGDVDGAARLSGRAYAYVEESGLLWGDELRRFTDARIDAARTALGLEAFAKLAATGAGLTLVEAAMYATDHAERVAGGHA